MVNKKPGYSEMVASVLEEVPMFENSAEYGRLAKEDLELPTIVVGAFTRFLCRLQTENVHGKLSAAEARALEESFEVIERFAGSPDIEVVNTVVVEIFEHLDLDPAALDDFKTRLGKDARRLYDKWIE